MWREWGEEKFIQDFDWELCRNYTIWKTWRMWEDDIRMDQKETGARRRLDVSSL
jgi:hypothetical protein